MSRRSPSRRPAGQDGPGRAGRRGPAAPERPRSLEPIAVELPPELPITAKRDEIADAILRSQVIVVAGETGSGKTTQLPKICLSLGRGRIAHTQPRRIAARTIAERIAEELGVELGGLVGYQVRFTDRVGPDTRIALMTDGILLNALSHDRMLSEYDTIIIDEAHERSLTIDFLLGYLKRLLPERPDLTVIVTSATIDPESFARHFADAEGRPAPIVEVSGRTFPVELRYRPLVAEDDPADDEDADDRDANEAEDRDYLTGIVEALDELAREPAGDVLVFLSGEQEIRDAEDAVRGHYGPTAGVEVLPLYGRLSAADQHRVFQPSSAPGVRRRVVLATNVAETSLTVPGIRYVVDAGTARISRYSTRAKVQRLPIEAISQASAAQRSGRSGRTSDGIAIRLYSEEDHARRPAYTDPEILRTNLAAVILQMVSLGLGDIADFPFLTPPDRRGVKDGLDLLTELGAIRMPDPAPGAASVPRLTRVGRDIARLPIDPRLARMVVESRRHGVSREVMAIVAGLSVQDPRERPLEKRPQADEQHARFVDPTSDFLTLLNLWNHLEVEREELSSSAFRRLCRSEYLNYLRVREWQDVHRQLVRLAKPLGLELGAPHVDPDGIHRSLLAGLLSHLGVRDDRADVRDAGRGAKRSEPRGPARARRGSEYLGARSTRFTLFPGSALARRPPAAVMSAELVETSRLFARTNAAIDLAWAERLAGDAAKRTYGEPHWERKQGAVVAYERVTLYGLTIVARRRVQYARIDLPYARDLFLRHALVDGDWDSPQAFERANRSLIAELGELEERTRRRDVVVDPERVHAFFDARVPAHVASTRDFEGWWRRERAEHPDLLTMTRADLVDAEPDEAEASAGFPNRWRQGDLDLPLTYRFEPGAADDGVTVEVPLAQLAALEARGFDAQVPGLRLELVTALLRSLPKAIRRSVVPAAEWAERILASLPAAGDGPVPERAFTGEVAAGIRRLAGTPVDPADFDLARVPAHLVMLFRVVDERGRTVGVSRDLADLKHRLGARTTQAVAAAGRRLSSPIERTGLTTWAFDDLPDSIEVAQAGGASVRGYPTLVATKDGVDLRVVASIAERDATLAGGVRALLAAAIPTPASYVQEHLTAPEKLELAASPYPSTRALFDDCLAAVIADGLARHSPAGPPTTRAAFERVRDALSADVLDAMFRTVSLVARVLGAARGASKAIASGTDLALLPAVADARAQLDGLVFRGFVSSVGLAALADLPRYLRAIERRLEQLPADPGRDRQRMTEVQTATRLFEDAGGTIPLPATAPARLVAVRWQLEELRVSLFAQALGTAGSVSVQRIRKALAS